MLDLDGLSVVDDLHLLRISLFASCGTDSLLYRLHKRRGRSRPSNKDPCVRLEESIPSCINRSLFPK